MKELKSIKQTLDWLNAKFPQKFIAYRKKDDQLWYITTYDSDIYLSKKFSSYTKILRKKFNLSRSVAFIMLGKSGFDLVLNEKTFRGEKLKILIKTK